MKIIFYLMGIFVLLFLFFIYYEDKREKDFLRQDIETAGFELVDDLDKPQTPAQQMSMENSIQIANEDHTTVLDEVDNTIQGNIRRAYDDAKGALKLRQ